LPAGVASGAAVLVPVEDRRPAVLNSSRMVGVLRLNTLVDTAGTRDQARQMSVSARLEAVLADGRRVVLLDDRGWTSKRNDGGDPWESETVEGIQREARAVVGPDEPHGGRSREDTEADHWAALARTLRHAGVEISGPELAAVPHDVEVSDRVRRLVGAAGG